MADRCQRIGPGRITALYEFLFTSKLLTAGAGLLFLVSACMLAGRPAFTWRIMAINFGPVFATGFFAAVLLSEFPVQHADMAAALAFEFVVLCLFCRLIIRAFEALHQIEAGRLRLLLWSCLLLYIALFLPSALAGGFGIFSEGTRIDYLYESRVAKYLTYGGLLLATVLAGVIARSVTLSGRFGPSEVIAILLVSATSILAGSKGGFLLWTLAIVGWVDFRMARIRTSAILLALSGAGLLVAVLAVVVSDFLGITIAEFFDLAFSRFFLNNDARALAIELRGVRVEPGRDLLSEAFRSLSTLFGSPPRNDPLGVELYDRHFGPMGGVGANASLAAMVIFYSDPGQSLLPFVLAMLLALFVFWVANAVAAAMPGPGSRFAMLAISALMLTMLSQDLLAFQVVGPLAVLVSLLLLASGSLHAIVLRRPREAEA